ncbi:MAG: 3-methyladenine DNA glycosylase 2 [Methylicorpusculum sp.]|uniref:DNA-3-methyladenine glycosylase family protein n=1 Tax=Methylicorpusculum sp. TaxID=2713644 RepID=UPI00271F09F9|nr:AlkA N-terminal domain-containing protein [Methylicorpusculum sp.]MDO8937590.1 3-methyladenine DNA glycosylase 2 [Methylicorpusculum sp.]MDP2203073.1 3-methyladenine DNA glycosylase 2 [Methylicorpusculum sp.]
MQSPFTAMHAYHRPTILHHSIELPADFKTEDFLAFHRRDLQSVAEQVGTRFIRKGLIWHNQPACLTIHFRDQTAVAELSVDGPSVLSGQNKLSTMVKRMLGLTQPIEAFEQTYRDHPQLGPLIIRNPGLRVPLTATPFEALTWAITGQQISVHAAIAIRRKLIQRVGFHHSCGLMCFPDAGQVVQLNEIALREAGYSQTKARTLLNLSVMILENRLPLDDWLESSLPVDEISARLLSIRGIGPWTINYALMRGFGWLDGSLHGDVAVRKGLQALLGSSEKISEEQTRDWLTPFSPYRALIAAHLWTLSIE